MAGLNPPAAGHCAGLPHWKTTSYSATRFRCAAESSLEIGDVHFGRWAGDTGLARLARWSRPVSNDLAHAWRANGCDDGDVPARKPGVAGSWFCVSHDQLSRLNWIWTGIPG